MITCDKISVIIVITFDNEKNKEIMSYMHKCIINIIIITMYTIIQLNISKYKYFI